MNITQLKQSLGYLFKASLVPLIVGRHGVGKSQTVREWCRENGYDMIDLRLGQMSDSGDLLGLPDFIKDKDGNKIATKFMRPSFLPTKPKTVLFLDEVNRAHKDIKQAIFQLILDKRINEYKLPEDCHIIAAANPNTQDYDTSDFIFTEKAMQDRFVQIKIEPTSDEFLTYARSSGLDSDVVGFLGGNGKYIQTMVDGFNYDHISGSNRSWEAVSKLEKLKTPENILKELMFGMVGVIPTQAYFEYKNNNSNKLDASEVLNNFSKVDVKVRLLSNPENCRSDVLTVTTDDLTVILKEIDKLSTEQTNNLIAFFKIVPKDLTKAVFRKWVIEVKSIYECPDFVDNDEVVALVD